MHWGGTQGKSDLCYVRATLERIREVGLLPSALGESQGGLTRLNA